MSERNIFAELQEGMEAWGMYNELARAGFGKTEQTSGAIDQNNRQISPNSCRTGNPLNVANPRSGAQ
ncbi:hypothetical protein [Serratia sp. (in: enterobacteria)]|uniref:hypothetical protein n=1 Tax=Serratia sp. (in: enterobacteria) TaxID=616 RepID=UPI0039899F66